MYMKALESEEALGPVMGLVNGWLSSSMNSKNIATPRPCFRKLGNETRRGVFI
jgi:hypothetical protein